MQYKACLVLLCLVSLAHLSTAVVYPTVSFDGWDVIWLDQPSYLYMIEGSSISEQFFVFGGSLLRVVTTGSNFTVQDHAAAQDWNQPFVGIHVFEVNNTLWAVGPTNPSTYTSRPEGYNLPIALAGIDWQTQTVAGLEGYILFNVFVDYRNPSDVLAYMVGWMPSLENDTVNELTLGVVRLHVNLNLPYAQRQFTYNPGNDALPLYSITSYTTYSSHFKPHVHYSLASNLLIVVDPATNWVYTMEVGPGITPMVTQQSQQLSQPGLYIASSIYNNQTSTLYIGYGASGWGNGSIVAYDTNNFLKTKNQIVFNGSLANPRALALDKEANQLYVGFNGGDAIAKLDGSLNILGYQTVPEHLVRMEGGRVGHEHIYFITDEQHSKVARVSKEDFCSSLCPWNGYCQKGKCLCGPDYKMSSDKKSCNIETKIISDKGAAVALGVLFALTFVAGAAGWALFWRSRSGYRAL